VNPDDVASLFYQQLVEVLAALVADVEQDSRIAQSLFHPDATDVQLLSVNQSSCHPNFDTSGDTI